MRGGLSTPVGIRLGMILLVVAVCVLLAPAAAELSRERWQPLARGVEYGAFALRTLPGGTGYGTIHVVRIDPAEARLKLVLASEHGGRNRSAAQWSRDFNLVAAINAGMFYKDYLTNVGYLRSGSHIQNRRWNRKYKSALAFGPRRSGIPAALMVDLDTPESMRPLEDYHSVVQNLRLMKGNGVNVWTRADRKWSESALGMDREGRVLFLLCRSPLAMKDFNEAVGALGLGVVRLMHMEGGPLASLSVRTGTTVVDLSGTREGGLGPESVTMHQWPIPNVIGVEAAPPGDRTAAPLSR